MNVLIVVPWDDARGGVIAVVDNLAGHLLANGHKALFFHSGSLLLRRGKTQLGYDGVRLRLPLPRGGGLRGVLKAVFLPLFFVTTLLQLVWFLRSRRIDIVNLHYPHDNYVYFAICRSLLPIRLVTSVHGRDAFYRERPLDRYSRAFRYVIRLSDLVVLPSDSYRKKFLDGFPGMRDRTIFIHNGIDPARFTAPEHGRCAPGRGRYLLCVAELQDYKAIDVLLHASKPLLEADPSLTLVLAGHGPLRDDLESLASSLGIRRQTMFLGPQGSNEIVRLLHGCEAKVLPSRMEPFGIVLIEAMACEVPVVATRVGGVPEIVEDGVSGLLVESENPGALTAALQRLLADDVLRNELARNGRKRVMERFCSWHNGAAYLNALASTLEIERLRPQTPSVTPPRSPQHDAAASSPLR